jgi:uncharacterized protein
VRTLRVVLDTNTLVSALLFRRDAWSWLRGAWKEGSIKPVLCSITTLELIRVLSYPKFKLARTEQEKFLEEILPYCMTRADPEARSGIPPCRDSKDQVFIELALEAQVDFLVSGDKDLLDYHLVEGFKIISPASLRLLLG